VESVKYLTTSIGEIRPTGCGFKVLDHVEGCGHHHYLIEGDDEEKLALLEGQGASWCKVLDDDAAQRYMRNHPRATKKATDF
jgi:hypothetical protein